MTSLAICVTSVLSWCVRRARHGRVIANTRSHATTPFIRHTRLHASDLEGRDLFIVGDVHGCYDELTSLVSEANARARKSLVMMFVGDLLRKGPDSLKVLRYVRSTTHTYTVRGNHEQVILHNLQDPDDPRCDPICDHLTPEEVAYLRDLPFTITIPALDVIVVHAGLIPGVELEQQPSEAMMNMRNLVERDDMFHGQVLTWSKSASEGVAWAGCWCGPPHVYFGHDALRRLQVCKHATGLDTGCVYGGRLTGMLLHLAHDGCGGVEVTESEFVSVPSSFNALHPS